MFSCLLFVGDKLVVLHLNELNKFKNSTEKKKKKTEEHFLIAYSTEEALPS